MNSLKYKESQFKYLCSQLAFPPDVLEKILENPGTYYKEWFEKKKDKDSGEYKTYADGTLKKRVIRPSLREMKRLQSKIKNNILGNINLDKSIHGGVKKRSNITNAEPHKGKKFQFTTDLSNFYPSVTSQMVYDSFIRKGFSHHMSHWLTKLTTWKYELPQGTPTSTHIANLVFEEIDVKLIELCNANGITYTRYIDDLTFSSPTCFKHLLNKILDIVEKSSFKINYRKTSYKGKQMITGIEVRNNYLKAPKHIQEKAKIEKESGVENGPVSNYIKRIEQSN